jgi:uncharacterized membrane protein YsdA (DUF1294 family)
MSISSRTGSADSTGVGVGVVSLIILAALLAVPVYALSQLAVRVSPLILFGIPMVMSLFTCLAYRSDKRRAEAGQWRIPESMLHLTELAGGWPGAFLGQRWFRHKTSKVSYQIVFWLIVLLHQWLALDSLHNWSMTIQAWHRL